MGEYADMMLDGTCCSSCGEYLGGDDGFPVMCAACTDAEPALQKRPRLPGYIAPDPNSKRSQKRAAKHKPGLAKEDR